MVNVAQNSESSNNYRFELFKIVKRPGMVVHTCSLNTWDTKTGESLQPRGSRPTWATQQTFVSKNKTILKTMVYVMRILPQL